MEETRKWVSGRNRLLTAAVGRIERIELGGLLLRVRALCDALDVERTPTGRHMHPFCEFSVMARGAMRWEVEGGAVVELDAAEKGFVMIPPNTPHVRTPLDTPSVITGFMLEFGHSTAWGKELAEKLPKLILRRGCHFGADPGLSAALKVWDEELEGVKPLCLSRLPLLVQDFVVSFFRVHFGGEFGVEAPGRAEVAARVETFIEENLDKPIALDALAARLGMSVRHLSRVFAEDAGVSLGKHIAERKMLLARWELAHTDTLVKAIAADLGFEDVGYFCRAFKKRFGDTPEASRAPKPRVVTVSAARGSS